MNILFWSSYLTVYPYITVYSVSHTHCSHILLHFLRGTHQASVTHVIMNAFFHASNFRSTHSVKESALADILTGKHLLYLVNAIQKH